MTQTTELERLLQEAAERHASDLHLLPGEPPVFRLDGQLVRAERAPLSREDVERIVFSAVGEAQARRLGAEQGHIVAHCGVEGVVSARLCVTRALGAYSAVARLFPSRLPTAQEARVPAELLAAAECPNGLVICSGASGSGKSTTAMVLVDHLNATRPVNILTIEDPVIMRLQPKLGIIRQQEVGIDTPSFSAGLRAALAQDPDVLYVAEIRDLATLAACIAAAQTGHMVITVVHAPSPEAAIQKMIDVQPCEEQPGFRRALAETLRAVCCQLLLPNASGSGRIAAYGVLAGQRLRRHTLDAGGQAPTALPVGLTLRQDVEALLRDGRITAPAATAALAGIGA